MGIFHFFGWFKKQFSGSIKNLSETQNFENIEVKVDNLMIDMNGIFHNSAQKIYQYGNFKPKERLLQTNVRKPIYGYKHQLKVFEDVCNSVEELLILVKPQKRLILCVDGPAPYAKQVQQKRRRFRSVMDREDDDKLDISIEDYLNLNKNTKRNLYGYKCPFVNWDYKDVEIDPYLLGLWLGDGTAISPEISNIDFEIIDFLQKFCNDNNFRLSNYNITYRICDDKNYRNRLISSLKKYNLIGNKHIPKDYLLNDKNSRLKLLAGMIDTDGNVVHDGRMIRINQCKLHERLFNDFVMLSQSLGFHINVNYYDSKKYFNVKKPRLFTKKALMCIIYKMIFQFSRDLYE